MIRHNVENQPHLLRFDFSAELLELFARADLGVYLRRIGDVIAMHASMLCSQNGRGINVGYAEFVEVRKDHHPVHEAERTIKLNTIGGRRNPHADVASNSRSAAA